MPRKMSTRMFTLQKVSVTEVEVLEFMYISIKLATIPTTDVNDIRMWKIIFPETLLKEVLL